MTKLTIHEDHSFRQEKMPGNGHMIFFEGFDEFSSSPPLSIALTEAEYVALYNVMKELPHLTGVMNKL